MCIRDRAKAEATERSLLHIIKPDIDFEPIADEHSPEVYDKAVEIFLCKGETADPDRVVAEFGLPLLSLIHISLP